jgi:hypothetical protein
MNLLQTENRVLAAIAGRLPDVPANSVMVFWQAVASTGWVRVTGISSTWGLRVVGDGMQGGGAGGQHDPVINDRVPSHTHGVSGSTAGESADHAHYVSVMTGTESALHTHGIIVDAAGAHQHTVLGRVAVGSGAIQPGGAYGTPSDNQVTSSAGSHAHTASASTESATHTHAVNTWTGGRNTAHAHAFSVTSTANAGADSWRPRYLDVLVCRKT